VERIRQALLALAHEDPSVRPRVLAVTREAGKWKTLPKGWDQGSVQKFWESLTGDNKHKVTKCIKEMGDKVDDPGAFCGSLADKVDPGWRSRRAVVRAYYKRSFNKFNAPELVAQLLTVLKKEGLKDAENQIRMKKVPELVEKAWAGREKTAADIRPLLTALFDSVQPYVKDFRRFIRTLAEGLTQEGEFPGWEWSLEGDPKVTSQSDGVAGGRQVGGGWHSPPEYEEAHYEAPDEVEVSLKASLPLRYWPRLFTKDYRHLVRDRDGFMKAIADLTHNRNALAMLKKLAKDTMKFTARSNPEVIFDFVKDEVHDWVDDQVRDGAGSYIEVSWEFDDQHTKLKQIGSRVTGNSLDVLVVLSVGIKHEGQIDYDAIAEERAEARMDDYEDRYDDRYASGKTALGGVHPQDFINAKTKQLAKRAWDHLKKFHPRWEETVDLPSNVGGFIKHLFYWLGNRDAYQKLHLFFGNMAGVGSGLGTEDDLKRLAQRMADQMNEAEAVAVGMLLLKAARRPRAAKAFETWALRHINLTQHSPDDTTSLKKPGDVFEEMVIKLKPLAQKAITKVKAENAQTLAFLIAEDINWHSLNRTGLLGGGDGTGLPEDIMSYVSTLGRELDWGMEPAAAFIVALLRKAGEKGSALKVKQYAIKEFPESFEG